MEFLSGIKIRNIFLHNDNWWNFYTKYQTLIRESIVINVCKVLICKTQALGFHTYLCESCGHEKQVFHSCKSRFCSSCGKKATEQWTETNLNVLPQVPWQHITFTLPQELRNLFWLNRHLTNQLIKIPAAIITKLGKQNGLIPGIFLALHTFGSDLKPNVHFHVSSTAGGLSLDNKKWIDTFYIHHQTIKYMWRYEIIDTLRHLYKTNQLNLPTSLNINSYTAFNAWLDCLYNKNWVIHLQKKSNNHHKNVRYLSRYLKRPPISETRIKSYDGQNVTYEFKDYYNNQKTASHTMSVDDFIGRLIKHIPDQNFRLIRYYNWLSNRTRSKLLPIVYELIKHVAKLIKKINWRTLFHKTFGIDPLECPICKAIMSFKSAEFATLNNILECHNIIATNKLCLPI